MSEWNKASYVTFLYFDNSLFCFLLQKKALKWRPGTVIKACKAPTAENNNLTRHYYTAQPTGAFWTKMYQQITKFFEVEMNLK